MGISRFSCLNVQEVQMAEMRNPFLARFSYPIFTLLTWISPRKPGRPSLSADDDSPRQVDAPMGVGGIYTSGSLGRKLKVLGTGLGTGRPFTAKYSLFGWPRVAEGDRGGEVLTLFSLLFFALNNAQRL